MTRLQRTATLSDLYAQVSRLTLALLCSLLVACGPPPPRSPGTEYWPTATAPALDVTPISGESPTAPTHLANPANPAGRSPANPAQNAGRSTENAGCSSDSGDAGRSTAGELHVALRENINTLNPYLTTNVSESFLVSSLYDTLADKDAQGHLVPNLAERWDLAADGTRLTCWLNPRARWHNGQPVTADDVVFSFDLIRRTAFPGLARVAALVGQAEALGPAEVQLTLLRPGPETVRRVCSEVRIVPAELWKSVQDPLTYANLEHPVGSGPFALLEETSDGGLVLCNTGMHHSTQPSIDRLIVEVVRDESQALEALQEGTFDLLGWDVSPAMARDVQDQPEAYPEIRLATAAGLSVHSLLFNLRQAPYDNPVLRLALAQAIDTQAMVDQVLLGFADRGTAGLFPPASPWYAEGLPVLSFDPQQAMEKLNLAGFVDTDDDGLRENPDGSALQILITCAQSDASLKVVELVVALWKAVGIKAQALPLPADQIRSVLMQAQFDVVLQDLALRDPEEAFFYFHSSRGLLVGGQVVGYNYGGYANADFDRVAEAMLEEQDPEKYLQLLRTLQGILAADLPQIPLYSPYVIQLYRDGRFSGWLPQPGVGLLGRTAIANLSAR
jgi:peptide/nickel transport system substrate-binding protein